MRSRIALAMFGALLVMGIVGCSKKQDATPRPLPQRVRRPGCLPGNRPPQPDAASQVRAPARQLLRVPLRRLP